ncbi:MAG: DUF2007 domain-containing protein [Actinobacteria bacterium]|nr:MAG: DUF2007 domain-containing protein [Actinomycetota bacterium]
MPRTPSVPNSLPIVGLSYGHAMPHPEPSSSSDRLVLVFSTASIPEGTLVRGLLEAEGIPAQLKGEGEGPYRMGPVYVWVPERYEVQARLLIAEAASGGTPPSE